MATSPLELTPEESARSEDRALVVLRRIERMMMLYGLLGLLVWAAFAGGFSAAIVLILTTAASIISFRGLRRLVWRIGVREGGKIDRRSLFSAGLRFGIILLLPAATLWLDSRQTLALVVGFSVLPAALMTEGLTQLLRNSTSPSDPPHGNC